LPASVEHNMQSLRVMVSQVCLARLVSLACLVMWFLCI
jgi:hypothetical protein